MKIKKLGLFLWFLFIPYLWTNAQQPIFFTTDNHEIVEIAKKNGLHKKYRQRAKVEESISCFVVDCQRNGYLSFSVDSIWQDSLGFHLSIFEGEKVKSSHISLSNQAKLLIEEMGEAKAINQGAIALHTYPSLSKKMITYLENRGYPFAHVLLDSLTCNDTLFYAQLIVEKNTFITFDTIVLKGDAKLKKSFLHPYLGIKKSKPYNEKVVANVPRKIRELPFATEIYPSGIEFVEDKAYLYLFLNKKKVNFFDGYLGIVPVDEQTGKVAFAGEVQLNLKNLFGVGESIDLLWRSPQRYSQYLKLHADFPYLFRTRIGIGGDFMLDKTDTTYLSINYLIGLQYTFANSSYLKAYFDVTLSNLLTTDFIQEELPLSHVDYKKTLYGIEFYYRNLDNIYNPSKGVVVNMNIAFAQRTIYQNKKILSELYEDLSLRTVHYRAKGQVSGFIPLHSRWVIKLSSQGGTLFGVRFFENELFKIGGMNSLRGFNEDEILASTFVIATSELRFLFARFAYLNLFFNAAWYERNVAQQYRSDFPYGFGVGVAFDTKAGLFYLSYALGKQLNNPISFKTGKIHFGLNLSF